MIIEILLMPCMTLILKLTGRFGSFLRKKYRPTSPREINSNSPFFFFGSSPGVSLSISNRFLGFYPISVLPDQSNQFIHRLGSWYIAFYDFLAPVQGNPARS